jgi:hypothetical protein
VSNSMDNAPEDNTIGNNNVEGYVMIKWNDTAQD